MKKLFSLLCLLSVVFALTACGSSNGNNNGANGSDATNTPAGNTTGSAELALITDVGTIDDKSFNQGAWEGVKKYAEENGKTFKYYKPSEKTTSAYLSAMDLAVEGGAKLIVCPGYLFEPAVFEAQSKYPEVKFILLDGQPQTEDYKTQRIDSNVYSIFYAEEQAGFLAGYAAVKDGYTKLGFMGGMAVPAVVRFGHGFVEGADFAAKELGLTNVDVKYHYTGGFTATPEAQSTAASWFNGGTEVIFACGGQVGNSVMAAAEANNGKVIGVDVDQSFESTSVITSALKQLGNSVYDGIKAFYADSFPGGQIVSLDATTDSVGLPIETSKFNKFTKSDYEAIFAKIVSGEIKPSKDTEIAASKIETSVVKVTEN